MHRPIRSLVVATALLAIACGNGQKPVANGGGDEGGSGHASDAGPTDDPSDETDYTVLADGLYFPVSLDADDSHVYWTILGTEENDHFDGQVERVSTHGGSVETIATDQTAPDELILGDENIYWANGSADNIMTWPKSGDESAKILSSRQQGASDLMIDDDFVYWVKGTIVRSAIVRRSITSGSVTTVHVIDEHPMLVESDDTHFYWAATSGDIWSIDKNDTDPPKRLVRQRAATRTLVMAITTSDTHLYWVIRGRLLDPDVIMRVPKAGGQREQIVSGRGDIGQVRIDGDSLYFSDSGVPRAADDDGPNLGRIMSVPSDGGDAIMVTSVDEREIVGITIVGDTIYFADGGTLDFDTGDWRSDARILSVDKSSRAGVASR